MQVHVVERCPECGRFFDLLNEEHAQEWFYGHDCEPLDLSALFVNADEAFDPAAGFGVPSLKHEEAL